MALSMPPMRLLPNLVLQLEQCRVISMWFLQIIESVLNLEVMKVEHPHKHKSAHTHTYTALRLCCCCSLYFEFSCPLVPVPFRSSQDFSEALKRSALHSSAQRHTQPSAEAWEINSDLNVLSWCVSVVKT